MTKATANAMHTMLHMLAYKRPSGSKTERKFIRQYILPLGVQTDRAGNLFKLIGPTNVLWSCHTDTVHKQGGTQFVDVQGTAAYLPKASASNCLGADDTAGVWLMCEMIRANKPGLYVFHRGEEIGLVGSSHIASRTPELLAGIDIAIALDRKGTSDVITFQQGERCASESFAESLSEGLGMAYRPSPDGVWTDTASYMKLVPECTNISVGYYGQHTKGELQDLGHLAEMLEALLAMDTSKLAVARDPRVVDYGDDFCWPQSYAQDGKAYGSASWEDGFDQQPRPRVGYRDLVEMLQDYPHEVADFLLEQGIDAYTVHQEIQSRINGLPNAH